MKKYKFSVTEEVTVTIKARNMREANAIARQRGLKVMVA